MSEPAETIDSTATEEPTPDEGRVDFEELAREATGTTQVTAAPGTGLTVRPPGSEVLMPLDSEQVVKGMEAYQDLLPKLLDESDYQDAGGSKKFVKKSGWRKIARAFNLSTLVVSISVERDEDGTPLRAEAVVRAMAPNGVISDADGYCSATEDRFKEARGRKKLENDMRATATTRAKNRAISDLVGMGEVSAEEMDGGGGAGLEIADAELCARTTNALCWLLPPKEAEAVWNKVVEIFGTDGMPKSAALALLHTIGARKVLDSDEGEPTPEERAAASEERAAQVAAERDGV